MTSSIQPLPPRPRRRRLPLIGVVVAAMLGACTDSFSQANGCPALCPEQVVEVKDTVLDAIAIDSTVAGYPPAGSEIFLLLSARGDSVDTRAIFRFDTLPQSFRSGGVDSAIYAVSGSSLTLIVDTTSAKFSAPVTLEAYDVDSPAPDTLFGALIPLFNPTRALGAVTLLRPGLRDTVRIPLADDRVLAKLTGPAPRRLRIGVRLSSSESAQLRVRSENSGAPAYLSYDPSPDTLIGPIVQGVTSLTPPEVTEIRNELADYTLIVRGDAPAPSGVLRVGGVPAGRLYFVFDAPKAITDSSQVLRATLLLTQLPNRGVDSGDSLLIYPLAVKASPEVTDPVKAAGFVGTPGEDVTPFRLLPSDSGQVSIDMVNIVRRWRVDAVAPTQRALVIAFAQEGETPGAVFFGSREAVPSVRPRLRISYVTRIEVGRP